MIIIIMTRYDPLNNIYLLTISKYDSIDGGRGVS